MLGIVAAFKNEISDYLKRGEFQVAERDGSIRFYQSRLLPKVVAVEGAVGREGVGRAARKLIERYRPDRVVSTGFAGGVRKGLKLGEVFLCDRLMAIEGPALYWGADAAKERAIRGATVLDNLIGFEDADQDRSFCGCLSVPSLVANSSMKAWIGANFPVSIIDMESYWVNETAAEYGIPHMVVRCVLDPVEQTLPTFVAKAVGDPGARRWERALRHIVVKPSEAPKLIRLATQVKVARASLGEFLATLSPGPAPRSQMS